MQAEELKTTLAKNENLEQELKDVKRELEKIKIEQTKQMESSLENNSQNILNRGTINAKNEFKMDANDLELVDRFAFKPKVSKSKRNRQRRRGFIFHVVRVLRKM